MPNVVLYTKDYCSFCKQAKALLQSRNIAFEEVDIGSDARLQEEVQRLSGRRTVPQIFIDGKSVGGFEELRELDRTGELDRMLRNSA